MLCFWGCSLKKQLAEADKLYTDGAYYKVEKKYKKLQRKIPKTDKKLKSDVFYRIGQCNRLLFNMKTAEKAYTQAIKLNYSDSMIYLNMAKVYQVLGNYTAATKNYERFLKKNPVSKEAIDGLIASEKAKELLKTPSRYKTGIANEFNDKKSSDFSPAFVGDNGESIVITTNRSKSKKQKMSDITGKLNFDLYTVNKNSAGKWEKPKFITELNSSEDDGTASFTSDGKTVYFTRCLAEAGQNRGGVIMKSTRSGGEWTEPQEVKLFNDSSITAAHPAISPDGNTLYFVSDIKNGFGNKDIYKSEHTDGIWSVPENLGDKINTSGNEMFPYFSQNGTLYFSSDGHQGFGGLDIFEAKKDSAGSWQVTNMLSPINSQYDDFGITFRGTQNSGYFSSNRDNNRAFDKIYYFEQPELVYALEGKVTDENSMPLSDAIVKVVGNDGSIIKQRAKKDGSYRVKLNKNVNYVMLASNRGNLNSSGDVSTLGLTDSKTYIKNFKLPSISKPVKMENVFYEFGKWELTKESETELNNLVKLLNDNPNITIELSAHTDSVGSDASNLELSQRRAQSVVNHLIKAGIAADRLTSKGYGKSHPVEVDKTLAAKYRFLKEGDVLNAQHVVTLTKEQQEICNQINRRTEFRVLRTTYNLY
jgi:peptidoglycan-associated lipoprotein